MNALAIAQPTVKIMDIEKLLDAPYNPRTITNEAFSALTESVRRFGSVQPVVWNKRTNRIVGGHQRVRALRNLGAKRVSVVVVDLDENEERALSITLNNPEAQGTFVAQSLVALLDGLEGKLEPVELEALRLPELRLAFGSEVPLDLPHGEDESDDGKQTERKSTDGKTRQRTTEPYAMVTIECREQDVDALRERIAPLLRKFKGAAFV